MGKAQLLVALIVIVGIATYVIYRKYLQSDEKQVVNLVDNLHQLNLQYNNASQWRLLERQKISNQEYYYYISIKDGDTTKTSQVYFNSRLDSTHVVYLDKKFFSNEKLNVIRFQLDTIYYYVEDTVLKKRTFKMGKYQYLARSGKLSPDELKFYYANKDSLDKVRGESIGFN